MGFHGHFGPEVECYFSPLFAVAGVVTACVHMIAGGQKMPGKSREKTGKSSVVARAAWRCCKAALQSQKAVTAQFSSEKLLPFGFAWKRRCSQHFSSV